MEKKLLSFTSPFFSKITVKYIACRLATVCPLCVVQVSHPGEPWLGPEEEDGSRDATRWAGGGGGHSNGRCQENRKGNENIRITAYQLRIWDLEKGSVCN